MSILSFHDVQLTLAGDQILSHVDWQIEPHDRIALVGRNGAGKSTLLKLLQGDIVQDNGKIHHQNGLRIAGLNQDVPISDNETVYHFLVKRLGRIGDALMQFHSISEHDNLDNITQCQQQMNDLDAWDLLPRIDAMANSLGVNPDDTMQQLSGGMKRRVLLAAVLLANPDLLLLDEPTNHLDINAIEWLESYMQNYSGSLLVVTHDREFLARVANRIVEIDRGQLYQYNCDYETYLDRREARRISEQNHNDLFDKRLNQAEIWLRTGIKARCTRNEGRVRALKVMREESKQRRLQLGKIKSLSLNVARSGTTVIEAKHLNYHIMDKTLVHDFSFILTRGDKVGIVGPNGCGKTTLVRLLLGELSPNSGQVRLGTSVTIAYFDQLREQLDEQQTILTSVGDGSDYVAINGKQKHVASYLREFLFQPDRFNQPVFSLSGGERNRLLLAKLFAKPVNLLVLDEPTNDLDIETMELLEAMLVDYGGTLLLISHDRAFINQVVTSILMYEGPGQFCEYVGGYDDYRNTKKRQCAEVVSNKVVKRISNPVKLSFHEQRELACLPQQIEALEQKIQAVQLEMATPAFYQQESKIIGLHQKQLSDDEAALTKLYARWEELENIA